MTEQDSGHDGRVTAPMQAYGSSEVLRGFVVLAIGVLVTVGIPLLLA